MYVGDVEKNGTIKRKCRSKSIERGKGYEDAPSIEPKTSSE
jgi:hypothetical protein